VGTLMNRRKRRYDLDSSIALTALMISGISQIPKNPMARLDYTLGLLVFPFELSVRRRWSINRQLTTFLSALYDDFTA